MHTADSGQLGALLQVLVASKDVMCKMCKRLLKESEEREWSDASCNGDEPPNTITTPITPIRIPKGTSVSGEGDADDASDIALMDGG